ncbi:dihydrodipicolinate synthase family protein [Devosia submarina]|uniref:dihydrodipicolinate synthase family protein n=1 Tax=Devosia submarina TaxID=1173082 RepID=UPI00130042D5|nr:dihydrodipicolinate synthase family protein [Devosia submarina]
MTQQKFSNAASTLERPETLPLTGIVAASLTPVSEDFRVDVERLEEHLRWLLAQGCTYVSPFGSTGEGPSFSASEKRQALEALATNGFNMRRVIPAAMSVALDDTIATIEAAADLDCRAVLIVPPYYYGARAEGIAAYFAACANRLGGFPIDVVLYHIPQLSRAPFTAELIEMLLNRHGDRIVGIKDSTGIEPQTLELRRRFPQLQIFTGDDRVFPALIGNGGAGMIGGMPNIVAAELAQRYTSPEQRNDADAIERAARRIEAVDANGGVVALKALKAHMTNDPAWSRPMPPLLPLDDAGTRTLVESFAATGFDFGTRLG